MTTCIHPAGQTDISDHHCRVCGAGRGTVLRDLRARVSYLRGSMREIEELSRDGAQLGHNNYVAINQAAEAALDGRFAEDPPETDEFTVPNLVAFVQRLSKRLLQCQHLHGPGNQKMALDALGFIERKGLRGSILRKDNEP